MEIRYTELRSNGRTISGTAMNYGEIARLPFGAERFEPGAFGNIEDVILNVQHDRKKPLARFPDGGLEILDSQDSLKISAKIANTQDGNDALELVNRKILRGMSIEFDQVEDRFEDGIRVIHKARLAGIGIVDRPAYEGTTVEVRRRQGRLRGKIPYKKKLACRCKKDCTHAQFQADSLKEAAEGNSEILAIHGNYANAIGSKSKGTLQLKNTRDALEISVDVPDNEIGRLLKSQSESVSLLARPVWDETESTFTVVNGTSLIEKASVRAILIGATDASQGWPVLAYELFRREKPKVWL